MSLPGKHVLPILAVALLLTAPAMLREPMSHDSFWIDWVWADQFTRELAGGNLYPRWLPDSHDGLGSPVFYYYPPLAFYVTGIFGLAGLSTYSSIIAAFFVGLVGSGLTMHAWLRESARAPLLGAIFLMAMPFHLLDFYVRGALAEFLAIALIPLIGIGIRRAVDGRILVAALAYAALIMTHLPLALLVSLFFIAPYALWLSRAAPKTLIRIAFPLSLGLLISAIYLLPALLLEPFRDAGSLWADASLHAENWSVLRWNAAGPPPGIRAFMASVMLVLAYASIVLLVAGQRVWGGYALLCCMLAAGLVPGFWTLPLLESVQFPFRLLPLTEFAVATAAAHVTLARPLLYAAILPALTPSAKFLFAPPEGHLPLEQVVERYPEVPENLPPGERPHSWPSRWGLEVAREHRRPVQIDGHTVAPVFYFPAWEVRCQGREVPTAPEPRTKLLTYKGSGCDRTLRATMPEKLGAFSSLAALLALIGMIVWRRFSPEKPQHSTGIDDRSAS